MIASLNTVVSILCGLALAALAITVLGVWRAIVKDRRELDQRDRREIDDFDE